MNDESEVASCTANRYLAVLQPVGGLIQCVRENQCGGQYWTPLQLFDSLSVVVRCFFFLFLVLGDIYCLGENHKN